MPFIKRVQKVVIVAVMAFVWGSSGVHAQNTGGNQGGGQGGGQGGIGQGGGQNQQTGGIFIDAEGVVRLPETEGLSAQLLKERREAFVGRSLTADLSAFSERRCVSLRLLEQECQRQLERQEPGLSAAVRYLAGLQRIDYLFVDQQSRDIVLAGPAEGFAPDFQGRMVGLTTGRPPLHLEDLVVALNSAFLSRSAIGCSIDPEPSRMVRMREFIRKNSSATSAATAARRYRQMAEILGLQSVSVFGVPGESHFAHVLVEADFRMKRISLGVEPSGVRGLQSHLSLLRPQGNSIQRWWFVPYYEALNASEDRTAYQLLGQRAQLLAQEEIAQDDGERTNAAFTRASTERFAKMFTEHFPELAKKSPVFAEMQNLFDLAVIAALLRKESLPQRLGWEMSLFLGEADRLVGTYAVPRQVDSTSTFRRANRGMILGLVGGVTIRPDEILGRVETPADPAQRLNGLRQDALRGIGGGDGQPSTDSRWWWD